MTQHNPEELRRREQELQEREHAIRLRELEAEINQPPLQHPIRHRAARQSLLQWRGKMTKVATFLAIVVAVIVALRVAAWLARVVIVGAIAWVVFKIFFEDDRGR
jgi:hypothetical protein